jgi:hypothetical protein
MHPALADQLIKAHTDELARQAAPRRARPRRHPHLISDDRRPRPDQAR